MDSLTADTVAVAENDRVGVLWLGSDVQGSVTSVADAAGGVLGGVTYDLFGQVRASSLTDAVRRGVGVGFTGYQLNADASLNARARQYVPSAGRFTGVDPVAWGPGSNPYSYVGNAPTWQTDPTGMFAQQGASPYNPLATNPFAPGAVPDPSADLKSPFGVLGETETECPVPEPPTFIGQKGFCAFGGNNLDGSCTGGDTYKSVLGWISNIASGVGIAADSLSLLCMLAGLAGAAPTAGGSAVVGGVCSGILGGIGSAAGLVGLSADVLLRAAGGDVSDKELIFDGIGLLPMIGALKVFRYSDDVRPAVDFGLANWQALFSWASNLDKAYGDG